MATTGTIRRILIAAAMCGGVAAISTVVYDGYMIRAEREAVENGQYQAAADFAGRVRLLKRVIATRLRAQIDAVAAVDRRFPRELPLIEALLAIEDDLRLSVRRAALRALVVGPDQLVVRSAQVTLGAAAPRPTPPAPTPRPTGAPAFPPPPGEAEPLLGAEPLRDIFKRLVPAGPDGPRYMLVRRTRGGAVIPVGEGQVGPFGRTFDVTPDGTTAWVARPAERMLERWSLAPGQVESFGATAGPTEVAIAPGSGGAAVAYTGPRDPDAAAGRREALYVWRDGTSRRVFPPDGTRVGALRFDWAPDGRSLFIRATDRPTPRDGDLTGLAWVADDGRELMTAVLDAGPVAPPPRWRPGPGARMGLAAAGTSWTWDGKADAAQPLVGVRGDWGWSPDGRLIAGIDVGHVFVALVAEPRKRMDSKVPDLPPFFGLDDAGFRWTADGLSLPGRAADREKGPWRKAVVTVVLEAKEPEPGS